ncbi:SpoIIIAH-like family protein [Desulfothermobacter acidiphilus]|uniref:SpoIIIAH-like family protein n=1 Tax=Desulfothermobacter acidiphilus TaxID=1938353 RepID=UPI003F88E9EC
MRLILVHRWLVGVLVLLFLLGFFLPLLFHHREGARPLQAQEPVIAPLPPGEKRTSLYADLRLERESRRSQHMELLREICKNPGTNEAMRREAQNQLMELTRRAEKETWLEGLLRAQGYEEVVVTIEGKHLTVLLGQELNQAGVERLLQFLSRTAGYPKEDITIVAKNIVVPRKGEGV